MRTFGRLFIAGVLFWSTSAQAAQQIFVPPPPKAQLLEIRGDVFVDSGNGFVSVANSKNANLKLKDRIMVAKGGSATLALGPNCSLPLQSPSMTVVEDAACVVGTQGTSPYKVHVGNVIALGIPFAAFLLFLKAAHHHHQGPMSH